MRDSFVFYRSFAEGISYLDPEDQIAALWAIINYALDETEPECGGMARAIIAMARPQIDENNKRFQGGQKGGRPKTKTDGYENQKPMVSEKAENQKPMVSEKAENQKPNVNVNVNENVNENDNVNVNENVINPPIVPPSGGRSFKPPTVGDVREYCNQGGYAVNPEAFVDFYESKGWMVGKNKMKDWKAAVRNWARSDQRDQRVQREPRQGKATDAFNNFDQRDNDYEALQNRLILQQMAKRGDGS